jgi:hypothetical protein
VLTNSWQPSMNSDSNQRFQRAVLALRARPAAEQRRSASLEGISKAASEGESE